MKDLILDLHQKTKNEAEMELEDFFLFVNENNLKTVKVITGWGSSSDTGKPILYNYVASWLKSKGYSFNGDYGSYLVYLDGEIRECIKY